jgi:hypothetical protein
MSLVLAVPRPYRIPLSTFWCGVLLIPTTVATLLVMFLASYTTLLVGIFACLVNAAFYFMLFDKHKGENSTIYTGIHRPPSDLQIT